MFVTQYTTFSPLCSTVGSSCIKLVGGAASRLVENSFVPKIKYLHSKLDLSAVKSLTYSMPNR